MNQLESEGYEAHSQHTRRPENPYLKKAEYWDNGWFRRQREQLIHELRMGDVNRLQPFWKWIKG